MRKYLTFFKMRLIGGLQYRAAALAGIVTQFAWGTMYILLYRAFYRESPGAFPMEFSAFASYIWMQQAFLALTNAWYYEMELFNMITGGNIAYELVRPADIYGMWYMRLTATRVARALLRCFPILIIAAFLPAPYGLSLPSLEGGLLFPLSMVLALVNVVSLSMVVYGLSFYTVSSGGLRLIASNLTMFCSGSLIPLPFLPGPLRQVLELLPFAAMENTPYLIYGGVLTGLSAARAICLQLFWAAALTFIGKALMNRGLKQTVVQGG